jgi:SAM-dependent methyltransferase
VIPDRDKGAPRLIEWTGERCVPWAPDVPVIYEHFHRYLWAAQIVGGRRVLDLGSGEGFGAAILAQEASEVVGVDIDNAAVEHSQQGYADASLTFTQGSVTDLSMFEPQSFDAVVAFEVIEHVTEHEEVLAEIRRVLNTEGILIMSTPDRHVYSEEPGYQNPFHLRELSLEEFLSLIRTEFEHCKLYGQSTISGSQIAPIDGAATVSEEGPQDAPTSAQPDAESPSTNFFLARDGEEWRLASALSSRYLIAVASSAQLPATPPLSTLADAELWLVRHKEEQISGLRGDVDHLLGVSREQHEKIVALDGELAAAREDLVGARNELTRIEDSVSFQIVHSLSARFYQLVPRDSRAGRAVQATLRLIGRIVLRRGR